MRFLLLAGAIAPATAAVPDAGEHSLTLPAALAQLDTENPALAEARMLAEGARERARATGTLPPPMVRAQTWNAPVSRPWSTAGAEMVMLGVEQSVPFPARLRAERSAARASASVAAEAAAARHADLVRDARVTFASYWLASRAVEIHRDHLALTEKLLASVESRYTAGTGRQHDVLRAGLEVFRQHASIHAAEGELESARASLAALLSLDATSLGVPVLPADDPPVPDAGPLLPALAERRPELRAAAGAEEVAEAGRRAARMRAWIPDVMIGVTWMDMTMRDDGAMAMVALELPWGVGGRRASARAADRELAAARAARRSAIDGAKAELLDAHARAAHAAQVLSIHRREILPRAERASEAVRASWVAGDATLAEVVDAIEQLLLARVEVDRARAKLESALADLDRAAGTSPSFDGARHAHE